MRKTVRILICALILGAFVFLPGGGQTVSRSATGDLNGDGKTEQYVLADGRLTVRAGGAVLWESPRAWRVDGFALGDVTRDGTPELVMTLWKRGSFGPVKPFWETDADRSYKQHLFVYRLTDDTLHPVWCSSNLDRPIVSFEVRDVDGDGLKEIVAAEGAYRRLTGERYTLDEKAPLRTIVLQWDGWGFRLCGE